MNGIGRYSAVVVLLLISLNLLADDTLLTQADRLLRENRAPEAYALLAPYQSERAGDPDYDYLLGVAALNSDQPNKAIFALERVLAVDPDNAQARLEIAQAYFAAGETDTAQREFEAVRQYNPPQEVDDAIGKYLDAIEHARMRENTTMQGFILAAVGSDSNVNSATSSSEIAIPAFGGTVPLDALGRKLRDTFYRISAGLNARLPLNPEWALFGGLSFNRRFNSSQKMFDTGSVDADVGLNLVRGDNSYSLALQHQSFDLDNACYRDATGLTAQWVHDFDRNTQASVYFQYSDLHYPGQDIRDAQRYIAGVAYAHALGGKYNPVFFVGGYGGQENERRSGVPHLGHQPYGLRAGGEIKLAPKVTLFGSMSVEQRNYHGPDPLFRVTRKDTKGDLSVGLNFVPAKKWTITPGITLTRNRSNIVVNDYNRAMIGVTVRRDLD